ncbi:MAG TPA: SH3 domain-containing protein, partial [Archangium sp.]|nr:SH3 domain-containing protein [Archangium sp.]
MRRIVGIPFAVLIAAALVVGCGGEGGIQNIELAGAPDVLEGSAPGEALGEASLGAGSELEVTANANLRGSPSAQAAVLLVIPSGSRVEAVAEAPREGFYKVLYLGREGWVFGAHLRRTEQFGTTEQAVTVTEIISRAQSGVGFSYWWGHGRWLPTG